MAEAVLVNGFENGGGDHQMSLSVNGTFVTSPPVKPSTHLT